MARYKITFVDKVIRTFEVEAASQEEAKLLSEDDAIVGTNNESWECITESAELA